MPLNGESSPLVATAIASRALRGAAAMAALGRLLLPELLGPVSLPTFCAGLACLCRGLGLDAALIHRQEEPEATATTHLFLQLAAASLAPLIGPLLAAA